MVHNHVHLENLLIPGGRTGFYAHKTTTVTKNNFSSKKRADMNLAETDASSQFIRLDSAMTI